MSSAYTVEVDRRCLRGLRLVFHLDTAAPARLGEALHTAFGPLQQRVEAMGARQVNRAVLPFRFELCWCDDEPALQLFHRFSSTPDQRVEDRGRIESVLSTLLAAQVRA